MRNWALIGLLLAGCGRASDEPTEVVIRVPSRKEGPHEITLARKPPPPVPVVTPNPDTVPPQSPPRTIERPVNKLPDPRPAAKPEPEDSNTALLRVEGVEFPDPKFRSHRLITFAAETSLASRAAGAFRDRNPKEIADLPATKAGAFTWLHLIWGYYPNPTFMVGEVQARFDPKAGLVRIVLPDWTARPGWGIGLDWARYRDSLDRWKYVGCRIQLKDLAPGDYSFEVAERDPKALPGDKPRVLASGRFTLAR